MSDARSLYLHSVIPYFVIDLVWLFQNFLGSSYFRIFWTLPINSSDLVSLFQNFLDSSLFVIDIVQALTCRSGSAGILSLIYSEIIKMLRVYGFLEFDVEVHFPHDLSSLPRGYQKQKSQLSDQSHIITTKSLLVKVSSWYFSIGKFAFLFMHEASHCPVDLYPV